MVAQPVVSVIATGGTISAVADARAIRPGGIGPDGIGADTITAAAVGCTDSVELRLVDLCRVSSRNMGPSQMLDVARAVEAAFAGGSDGVVVTHGTDTIEETAYLLALTVDASAPVALTGAMRLPDDPGSDGPANVRAAVSVAAEPAASSLGPVVVLADRVHAARWVTKSHTTRVDAFSSPGCGPVAELVEGRVRLLVPEIESEHLGMPATLSDHVVEVVWMTGGADGRAVDALAQHAHGLVVAALGAGHVPAGVADAIGRAVDRGVTVVIASRCGAGSLLTGTYGGPGSEGHLRDLGALPASGLAPVKARLRLHVALALGLDPAETFPT